MLTIGKVATMAGLRTSAIRYYEEEGLVPPAHRHGGKRIYNESVLDRLALIELAKHAGFTIREIRNLLAGMDQKQPASARWAKLAQAKLADLDQQMLRASRMKDLLSTLIRCDCPTMDDCGRVLNASRPWGFKSAPTMPSFKPKPLPGFA